jgi:hypothetical protein
MLLIIENYVEEKKMNKVVNTANKEIKIRKNESIFVIPQKLKQQQK